ncbi:IclR family transcriptional regulator [Bacillus benzoevorans]|uniref:DNA-binding IclR family transcriptional regulator n=1 Tax=Bacillus benzoevorans TaxID=1456 RepID=A0A7X0LXD4_9BACI|nr:IclR family transcriptional regulator [Bacillus benzoevorans]MBB6446309.1 DNA-binding IclR family transcriptional regulator [Bacillus benzoevorans]
MENNNHHSSRTPSIQVIARAAAILRALKEQPKGLSLAQIAKEVDLPRSTVQRIIASLEQEEFVTGASANGGFRLGPEVIKLAASVNYDLREEMRPFLIQLSQQVNETVDLSIIDNGKVLFVDQIIAPHPLQATSQPGAAFPLHCTANGKAILATLPKDEIVKLIPEQLERYTEKTITTRDELIRELEMVRREGVAYSREEHIHGVCAIGAAVVDRMKNVCAVSIPLPAARFFGNEKKLAEALHNTCQTIKKHFDLQFS